MKIQDKTNFGNLYNATAYVQTHTLVNRGITTIGGSTIPQTIMSNNKHEARERATMGSIYFIASYLTPIVLLPLYNKHFLKNKGITKSLNDIGKKIIEVPKRYLTPEADLKKGLDETAKIFDKNGKQYQSRFDEIYNRYSDSEKLKKDLLNVHEKVLMTDFITTAAMWSAIPWIATEMTEKRTGRKDFSAGFNMKDESIKTNNKELSKKEKLLLNIGLSVIPGILFAKSVTKGISLNPKTMKNNFFNNTLKKLTQNPDRFNYTSGTNMSKTIYAAIWLLSSFPAKIISARDKNERKDRAVRNVGLFTMFFGGDYLLNNTLGRASDKFLGTQIMDTGKYKNKEMGFLEKFKLPIKDFKELEKDTTIPLKTLNKTKKVGAALYWTSLAVNTALIGFGLPKVMNKFLKHNIEKDR